MGMRVLRIACLMLTVWLVGCSSAPSYYVEGTVVELMPDGRIMVEHEEIEGFMDAMTMPFQVKSPTLLEGVKPGDRIFALLVVGEGKAELTSLRVTATSAVIEDKEATFIGVAPVRTGEAHPAYTITLSDGTTTVLGAGQGRATALTYIYTTCPMPNFCPAITERLQKLQPLIEDSQARILAVTIDPATDTPEVLQDYATLHGAKAKHWGFGRVADSDLKALSQLANIKVNRLNGDLVHAKRLLVLSPEGKLIERYDDANWPVDRVAQQLKEGTPAAPLGTSGTLTP